MKLCVFQGTFNPIHRVHLLMAAFVKEQYGFDEILFIPAYKPPHKKVDENLAGHRLNMVKLAAQAYQGFCVSDIEFENERFSYTYLTILELYKRENISGKINFIIGTDAFLNIETWYEIDKLKELVEFIVLGRGEELPSGAFRQLKEKGFTFKVPKISFENISSTQIRQNLDCRGEDYLLPCVREYIEKNGLYK